MLATETSLNTSQTDSASLLLRQIAGYAPGVSASALSSFVIMCVGTRLFTPDEFGRLTLTLTVVLLVQAVGFSWIRSAVLRFYEGAARDAKLDQLLASVALCAVTAAGLFGGIYLALVATVVRDPTLRSVLWWGLPLCLLKAIGQIRLAMHSATGRVWRYTFFECGQSVVGLIVGIFLASAFKLGAVGLLCGMCLGLTVLLGIDLVPTLRKRNIHWQLEAQYLPQLVRYGTPVALDVALAFGATQSDRLLLNFFIGTQAVGVYSVGAGVPQIAMSLVFTAVAVPALPLAIRALERHGEDCARERMNANGVLFMALAIPACVGIVYSSPAIIGVLVGRQFQADALGIMPWAAVGALFAGINGHYLIHPFLLRRRTNLQLVFNGVGAVVAIIANFLLIPRFGSIAPVFSYLLAQTIVVICQIVLMRRIFPIQLPIKAALQALLACVPMAAVLKFVPFPMSLGGLTMMIVAGAVAYGAAAIVLDLAELRTRFLHLPPVRGRSAV
jgi:O-antigen/teichoic acid export membrane protein